MVERFATVPSPMTAILLEHFHGAVTRVGVTATAVPHRQAGWNLAPPVRVDRPGRHGRERALDARDATPPCAEHLAERRWLNYLGDDQDDDATRAAYGPNSTGCGRSSGATTPRTSSITTTTSGPEPPGGPG